MLAEMILINSISDSLNLNFPMANLHISQNSQDSVCTLASCISYYTTAREVC